MENNEKVKQDIANELNKEYLSLDPKDRNGIKEFSDKVIANVYISKMEGEREKLWEEAESYLFQALILYVLNDVKEKERNLSRIYNIIHVRTNNITFIEGIFDSLPLDHPAKLPFLKFDIDDFKMKKVIVLNLFCRLEVLLNRLEVK